MSDTTLKHPIDPIELTDAELDHVHGGVAEQRGNNTFIWKGPEASGPADKIVHHGGHG